MKKVTEGNWFLEFKVKCPHCDMEKDIGTSFKTYYCFYCQKTSEIAPEVINKYNAINKIS